MNWTKITDDPESLPPSNENILVLCADGDVRRAVYHDMGQLGTVIVTTTQPMPKGVALHNVTHWIPFELPQFGIEHQGPTGDTWPEGFVQGQLRNAFARIEVLERKLSELRKERK